MAKLTLSNKGYREVFNIHNDEFCFKVGGHKYYCSQIFAAFLCPKISYIIKSDPLINLYTININDNQNEFSNVMELCYGGVTIDENNANYFYQIAHELGNNEMLHAISSIIDKSEPLNYENALNRLKQKIKYYSDEKQYEEELSFIASNFCEFNNDDLRSLNIEILMLILKQHNLVISSEKKLLRFILSLNSNYFCLLQYVSFENLYKESIDYFLKNVKYDDLNGNIWTSVCRLIQKLNNDDSTFNENDHNKKLFIPYIFPNVLEGILTHLKELYKGNPHIKKAIEITCSTNHGTSPISKIADMNRTDWFFSSDVRNSWVKFNFKQRKIRLTGYSLKGGEKSTSHLMGWVLEGSNDDNHWDILDSRKENSLVGEFKVNHYVCNAVNSYKYLRIRQTEPNYLYTNVLVLSNIEFFGYISQ